MNIKQLKVLRKEDRCAVYHVMQYLAEQGLEVTIGGSAATGAKDYHDVDLLAQGAESKLLQALTGFAQRRKPKSFVADTANFQTQHAGLEFQVDPLIAGQVVYMQQAVDYRFQINAWSERAELPQALKIDVCLKDPKSEQRARSRGFYLRDIGQQSLRDEYEK